VLEIINLSSLQPRHSVLMLLWRNNSENCHECDERPPKCEVAGTMTNRHNQLISLQKTPGQSADLENGQINWPENRPVFDDHEKDSRTGQHSHFKKIIDMVFLITLSFLRKP
jgi:hypothetical protein